MSHVSPLERAAIVGLLAAVLVGPILTTHLGRIEDRENSVRRCEINTGNLWADVLAYEAQARRERFLSENTSGAERVIHIASADAAKVAADEKRADTRPVASARTRYCREQWPAPSLIPNPR